MDEHEELHREKAAEQSETTGTKKPEIDAATLLKDRMLFVMLIVAVLCGGNGIGIVAAGLFWKRTQNLAGAVGIVVAVTAAALVLIGIITFVHQRKVKKRLEKLNEQEKERNQT